MRRRQPRSWILLISAICALAYFSLQYSTTDWMTPSAPVEAQRYPDTYLQGVRNVQYNEQGQVQYHLKANHLTHYEALPEPYSVIKQPRLLLESDSTAEAPWEIVAERGIRFPRRQQISLEEAVHAWSLHPQHGQVDIFTDSLIVDAKQQFAHTQKPVTMRSAYGVTTAVGLEADIESGRITLVSEVKGTYDPQ